MELLLNELSLQGQFLSIDEFLEKGLTSTMLPILKALPSNVKIYKSYNFYDHYVCKDVSIHKVLISDYSRTIDEIRRYKSLLNKFFENPYWEDDPQHSFDVDYLYEKINVTKTSIAESCEREQLLLSFCLGGFDRKELVILKEKKATNLTNIINLADLQTVLRDDRTLLDDEIRFKRTSLVRQGKPVFEENSTGKYWYLDNLHKNHYEVFNSNKDHLGTANLEGIMISDPKDGRKL